MHHPPWLSAWLCASDILLRSWELVLRAGRHVFETDGEEGRVASAVKVLSGDELRSFSAMSSVGHDERIRDISMVMLQM